jgi:hypothetical protein
MLGLGQNVVAHYHARRKIDDDPEWFASLRSRALQNLGEKLKTGGRGSVCARLQLSWDRSSTPACGSSPGSDCARNPDTGS